MKWHEITTPDKLPKDKLILFYRDSCSLDKFMPSYAVLGYEFTDDTEDDDGIQDVYSSITGEECIRFIHLTTFYGFTHFHILEETPWK